MCTRRALACLLLTLVAAAMPPESAAQGPTAPLAGRPLEDALRELQASGLPIVFSSATVPADAVVVAEPTSGDPERALAEILAPHGLAVRRTRGGKLVVVRAVAAMRELRGEVRSALDQVPIADVRVRLVGEERRTLTDRGGRFALATPSTGEVTLQLEATGYRSLVRHVGSGDAGTALVLQLEPLPVARERIEVSSTEAAGPAAPVTGGTLDRLELERQPELVGDPLRAAGHVPGVSTQYSARPLVRGAESGSVGIEVDGVELYEPYHLLDFGGLISIVPAGVLAELEIDTGGFDASRGDRLGGAFDMTTLVPEWRLRGAAEIGPLLAGAHASGQGPSGRYRWLGSARVGLLDATTRLLEVEEDPSYWDAFVKGSFEAAEGHELRLQGLWAGDDLSAEHADADGLTVEDYQTRYRSRYVWLSHLGALGRHAWVEHRLAASEVDGVRDGSASLANNRFVVADDRRLDVFDLRQDGYASLGSHHELQWGGELRQINVDLDYASSLRIDDPVSAVRTNPPSLEALRAVSLDGRQEAIYVQDRWRAGARLTLLAGLRWENGSLWGDRLVHPRAQLVHQVSPRDRWSLAWGRHSQSQRPYELSIEDGEVELQPIERAEEAVLGYERSLPRGSRLTLELFDRSVAHPRGRWANLFDPVSLFPETEPDRVRVAATRVRAQGASIALAGRIFERLEGSASISTTGVRERVDGEEVAGAGDQPWDARLRLSWDPGKKWSLRLAWRHHTGAPTTPLILEAGPDGERGLALGPLRSEQLADLQTLDLEAVRGWRIGRHRLELVLELENAANSSNPRGYSYEVIGAPASPSVQRQELFWPGRLPSFRLRFEL